MVLQNVQYPLTISKVFPIPLCSHVRLFGAAYHGKVEVVVGAWEYVQAGLNSVQ